MQALLKTYKERLINLNTRNSSLYLGKIYKKRSFDLFCLNDVKEGLANEILEFLLSSSEESLTLIPDPYLFLNEQKKAAEKQIKNGDINLDEYQLIDDRLNEIHKQMIDLGVSLKTLLKEISVVEKEKGRYELYIGFPFVEGKFKDGTVTRAPLVLFPVSVTIGNECRLFNKGKPIWNNVFIRAFSKFNEADVEIPDDELNFNQFDNYHDAVQNVLQLLKNIGIMVNGESEDSAIIRFEEIARNDLSAGNFGNLKLVMNLVLGRFPIANSIYNDYLKLEKKKIQGGLVTTVFGNSSNSKNGLSETEYEDEHKLYFSERATTLFTHLDASQERAVKKAGEEETLVIYGPPGTGKSQTIANIVVDALHKGEKVLVVSQKRAALDVVYNRLAPIHPKVMLIHDSEKGKQQFYKTTVNVLESKNITKSIADFLIQTGKEIDERIEELNVIARTFDTVQEFGLTLQQMYSLSKSLTGNDDPRYKRVLDFLNSNSFRNFTYDEIVKAVKNISNSNIINIYFNYQKLIEEADEIKYLSNQYNEHLVYDNVRKISDLKQQLESIDSFDEEHMILYCDKLSSNSLNPDQISIDELSSIINEKNAWLLDPLPKNSNMLKQILETRKIREQEEANRQRYNEFLNYSKLIFDDISRSFEKILDMTSGFASLFKENYFNKLLINLIDNRTRESIVEKLCKLADPNFCDEVLRKQDILFSLPQLEKEILKFNYKKGMSSSEFYNAVDGFTEISILANIKKIESKNFINISKYENYNTIVNSASNLMNEKYSMTGAIVRSVWDQKLDSMDSIQLRELKRQCNKKRGNPSVRTLLSLYREELQTIYPCWLLGPETISEIMPFEEGIFDLIIFDEASQLFIEESLPAIYRGKRVIVAGDDKQLRPNALFSGKLGIELNEEELLSAEYEEESLLDLAKVKFKSSHLNFHYRSIYEELINFSNYAFYNGRLQISPNIEKNIKQPSIKRIKVDGKWMNTSNVTEAETVVNLVENILSTRTDAETVGIITFNVGQKELIEERLEHRANDVSSFQSRYTNEIDREINGEDVSLFVKNIENVQGDERDIIIFSVAYAKDEHGRVSSNFGSLTTEGGENRLNVAISRAKKAIYIVTSIEPEELNVDDSKNRGPKLLKKYLQYARAVSNNDKDVATSILNSLLDTGVVNGTVPKFDSPFETEVYDALRDKGYLIDTQVGVSGYKIDLGVYDDKTSGYILGIECDGAAFHSSKNARERDIHRQRYLESRGWNIHRIWSRDWWKNQDKEIAKICSVIDSRLKIVQDNNIQECNSKLKKVPEIILDSKKAVKLNESKPKDEKQLELTQTKDQLSLDDIIDFENEFGDLKQLEVPEVINNTADSIDKLLRSLNIPYIDKRDKGGALWIFEKEIKKDQIKFLKEAGFPIAFAPNGGKATRNNPAYYYKD